MKGERSRTFSDGQVDEIARRYRAGESTHELARAFDCSTAPIRNALKMRGVRMRLGGGRNPTSSGMRGWGIS